MSQVAASLCQVFPEKEEALEAEFPGLSRLIWIIHYTLFFAEFNRGKVLNVCILSKALSIHT